MFLRYVPPMGIYETLYAFWGALGAYMGEAGTHSMEPRISAHGAVAQWAADGSRSVLGPRWFLSLVSSATRADRGRVQCKEGAAILKGTDCDMARLGDASPLANFFRFSFGPLDPTSFENDIEILKRALT